MESLHIEKDKFFTLNELFSFPDEKCVIAGPCSIESLSQMEDVACVIKKHNLHFIRGGAYKPRSSPYSFQGLGEEGLRILDIVRRKYDLRAVTEVMDTRDVSKISEHADVLQIGARNMMNYSLLKEVGGCRTPVLLKRNGMATVREFLLAAEYIYKEGNTQIIMCERGIRTFESSTRNTLDLSCVAIIKKTTDLPIIVDLSHSLGRKDIILPMAKAAFSAGANGIMVETHPNPKEALSDSSQQLNCAEFEGLLSALEINRMHKGD